MKCVNIACDQHNKTYFYGCEKLLYKLKCLKDCVQYKPEKSSFDQLVGERCGKIKAVLQSKAKEYVQGGDRFHNFKVAADIVGGSPEEALHGMMLKHIVSVLDLIKYPETRTKQMVDEKVGDNINYLILLEGIMLEGLKE